MREIRNFNSGWIFTFEKINFVGRPCGELVDLPHTWNGKDGQDGGGDYYRGCGYYAKEFDSDELPNEDLKYLEINGANSSCEVFLNGKFLAAHHGGYSKFRVELTNLEKHNLLIIKVDNSSSDSVYPQFADFTFYGGLYRDVNIIGVPFYHFDLEHYSGPGLRTETEIKGKDAILNVEVFLKNTRAEHMLELELFDNKGISVSKKSQNAENRKFSILVNDVHLWSGKSDPYLYRLEARLIIGGECKDKITSDVGFRDFSIDPDKGFFLNGHSYPLRGVSRHQDRPEIGNALLREHHKEDAAIIDELGANAIRLAHYQHDDYFYSLCDKYGFIVWAEIPYISRQLKEGRENAANQMHELVIQNYNHPSICFWGLSNEITMGGEDDPGIVSDHLLLNGLCHSLDPKRKTTLAAVSMCSTDAEYLKIPDLVAYNHYFGWYGGEVSMNAEWFDDFHSKYPKTPIGISEYGAEALDWHSSEPVQGDYTEEYQATYHEEMIKMIDSRPYIWASFVWNMFDFAADARCEGGEPGMNHKGLVSFDRSYKKDAFYAYKAWLSGEPFVHICGKRYRERADEIIKIKVYSNLPEVELFVNGESLEKQSGKWFFEFEIKEKSRSLRLVAKAGSVYDEAEILRVDKFPEKYRLKDLHAILNWFEVTMPEGKLSINDKISSIIATEKGKRLFDGILSKFEADKDKSMMQINDELMKMLGNFSLLRFAGLSSTMGLKFTKEDLLELNAKLNLIDK